MSGLDKAADKPRHRAVQLQGGERGGEFPIGEMVKKVLGEPASEPESPNPVIDATQHPNHEKRPDQVQATIICPKCDTKQIDYVLPHFKFMECYNCGTKTYIKDINDDATPDTEGNVKFGVQKWFSAEERYNHRQKVKEETAKRVEELEPEAETEEMNPTKKIHAIVKSDRSVRADLELFTVAQLKGYMAKHYMSPIPRLKADIIEKIWTAASKGELV